MTTPASAASLEAAPVYHPRRWLAAVVMMVAALMDMIDLTIVNVALPTIGRDLGASGTRWSGWSRPTCWPSRPP